MMQYTRPHLRLITNSVAESPPSVESEPPAHVDEFDEAFAAVETLMNRVVNDHVHGPLRSMVTEHLKTGGKLIRAQVALRSAMALGLDPRDSVNVAAACELLHNATLVHDDLQDGDTIRRTEVDVIGQAGRVVAITGLPERTRVLIP